MKATLGRGNADLLLLFRVNLNPASTLDPLLRIREPADALMDRPLTSKSRGICRYYNTSRGCFAGDSCKFLHGDDERLTPYDKAKVCRYFVQGMSFCCPLRRFVLMSCAGHCTRGDKCWFLHEHPKPHPGDSRTQVDAESCCICMEKPVTYGLLSMSYIDCTPPFVAHYRAQRTAATSFVYRYICTASD